MYQGLLIDKTPDQLKLPYTLWARESVAELFRFRYGMACRFALGHDATNPQKRAYGQRAPEVKAWLEEEYPAIQAQAKAEDAEIYWGDETGLRNDCQHERGYAPKGKHQ